MKGSETRVVITGMGAITPLGETVEEYWDNLVNGVSGIGPMTLCDPSQYPSRISAEVSGFDPGTYIDRREHRRMARFSQMSVAAAGLAIEDAGLDLSAEDTDRIGVVMGNGNGGFPTTEDNARVLVRRGGMRMSPFFIPMILPNMAAANVSRIYGLKGTHPRSSRPARRGLRESARRRSPFSAGWRTWCWAADARRASANWDWAAST